MERTMDDDYAHLASLGDAAAQHVSAKRGKMEYWSGSIRGIERKLQWTGGAVYSITLELSRVDKVEGSVCGDSEVNSGNGVGEQRGTPQLEPVQRCDWPVEQFQTKRPEHDGGSA